MLVIQFQLECSVGANVPGQIGCDIQLLVEAAGHKGAVIQVIYVGPVTYVTAGRERAGCIQAGPEQIVGAELLLQRITRRFQGVLGHGIDQSTGFHAAVQHSCRAF